MAMKILLNNGSGIVHEPRFDLESLFYVLIYLCMNLKGPGNQVRTTADLRQYQSFPLAEWFSAEGSFRKLGRVKMGQLVTFEQSILNFFPPYFNDLKPCVTSLYRAICPHGNPVDSPVTHDMVISIFDDALKSLPLVETLPKQTNSGWPLMGSVVPFMIDIGQKRGTDGDNDGDDSFDLCSPKKARYSGQSVQGEDA